MEVVAVESKAGVESVVWLGCVQYDGLRRVWESRASQTVSQRLSQTNLLSIFGQSKVQKLNIHLGILRGKKQFDHSHNEDREIIESIFNF